MALPPPKVYRQDMPPTGGFQKPVGFPVAGFRKRSPVRGPTGALLVGGALAVMGTSWYFLLQDIDERKCVGGWVGCVVRRVTSLSLHPSLRPHPPTHPHTTLIHTHTYSHSTPRRSYYNLSRFNEKFERAYVMQAREEVAWTARQKELLDNERRLMAGVPGWVTGRKRYFTQWEDRPDRDVLDKRKLGPW